MLWNGPEGLNEALRIAAEALGNSLNSMGYPNGGRDSVFAEANLVAHLAHGLLSLNLGYSCYAEASHTKGRRIDLLASNGRVGIAFEAKLFGNVGGSATRLLADLERISEFSPRLSPLKALRPPPDWWSEVHRWGGLLVGSHAPAEVNHAWENLDPEAAKAALVRRPAWEREAYGALIASLSERSASTGAFHICDGDTWERCLDAKLLYAVFRL